MTDEEYRAGKLLIIKEHGEAEWSKGRALNESARQIAKLRSAKARSAREWACDGPVVVDASGEDVRDRSGHILAIDIKETSIEQFTPTEQRILKQFFLNVHQSQVTIADKLRLEYHTVNRFMTTDLFKAFYSKVFKRYLPMEAYKTMARGLKGGDNKLAVEVLRDAGEMKNETINITGRLEDPRAMQELKELGDRLALAQTVMPSGIVPIGDTLQ